VGRNFRLAGAFATNAAPRLASKPLDGAPACPGELQARPLVHW